MSLSVIVAVFPLVFLAELPDKTMFASLVLATRGRPLAVWLGACLAFAVHVVIAVSVGVAVFSLLPHRVVQIVVGLMFAGGALYAYLSRTHVEAEELTQIGSHRTALLTATGAIFLAEWGDLTQVLTANLAVHYRDWLSVGVAAQAALMAVAGLAVLGGSRVLGRVRLATLRLVTAVVLAGLAVYTLTEAVRGR